MKNIEEISTLIKNFYTEAEIIAFFKELLTESELETLSKRWRIMRMLADGSTQREIANELGVSLCKVTRGSKILKDKNSILTKKKIASAYLHLLIENPEEIKVNVLVRIKDLQQIVEVTTLTTKFTLRAEESHADLYAAVPDAASGGCACRGTAYL